MSQSQLDSGLIFNCDTEPDASFCLCQAQTVVVVSCEEDRALCERARSLSFPVVSAEFLLTGILQQKADVQTHALSLSPAAAAPKPAARARRK